MQRQNLNADKDNVVRREASGTYRKALRDRRDITSGRLSDPKDVVAGAGACQRYDDDESCIGRGAGVECSHREKRGTISRKEPKKRFLETLNQDSEIEDDNVRQLLTGKIRARVRNSNPLGRKKRKKNMNVTQPDEDKDEIEPGTAPATRRRTAGFVQPRNRSKRSNMRKSSH
ncbi:hypothetical protein FGB62_27g03 [Gracilaria domingensis]|nr:hypothetical protein FGB62_27g03 [Gracilaria domingensis]